MTTLILKEIFANEIGNGLGTEGNISKASENLVKLFNPEDLPSMLCEACGKRIATDRHHKFSQTRWARALYGKQLDDPRNIMRCCNQCHASHASTKLIHWDENEYCAALGIKPRSKLSHRNLRLEA